MRQEKSALVLFSFKSHKHGYIEMLFERLATASKNTRLALTRGSLKDLQISVIDGKMSIRESLSGKDLRSFDLLYFELWYKSQQQALAAALYAQRSDIPFFNKELLSIMPITKVGELAKLADGNVSLPNTFMSSSLMTKKVFKANAPLTFPLVVKAADGYGGKNNFLVSNYGELVRILDTHKDVTFVIQEFIPNDCDYRCLVMGGEIVLVLKRTRSKDSNTHLNNTSAGAEGKVIPVTELSQDARDTVIEAARVLGREEFCGVDLMLHKETGQPYILEVNQTPQIEIGAEINKKMSKLLKYMSERAGA